MEDSNTGWFLAGVSTVIATLASVVAFLFKMNESKNTTAILALQTRVDQQEKQIAASNEKYEKQLALSDEKHEKCEQHRQELALKVANLEGQLDRYITDQTDSKRFEIERKARE